MLHFPFDVSLELIFLEKWLITYILELWKIKENVYNLDLTSHISILQVWYKFLTSLLQVSYMSLTRILQDLYESLTRLIQV